MKRLRTFALMLLGLVAMSGLLFYAGCEDEPSNDNVDNYFENSPYTSADRNNNPSAPLAISPSAIKAKAGQQVGYAAGGGRTPYSWSVGTPANGAVQAGSDTSYAIYTHLGDTNSVNSVIVSDSTGAVVLSNVN